jgi:hypothetical protein
MRKPKIDQNSFMQIMKEWNKVSPRPILDSAIFEIFTIFGNFKISKILEFFKFSKFGNFRNF